MQVGLPVPSSAAQAAQKPRGPRLVRGRVEFTHFLLLAPRKSGDLAGSMLHALSLWRSPCEAQRDVREFEGLSMKILKVIYEHFEPVQNNWSLGSAAICSRYYYFTVIAITVL